MPRLLALLALAVLAAFVGRPGDGAPVLPATPLNYAAVPLPAHLTAAPVRVLDSTPFDNPVSDAGATLGRVLFYDTRLSANRAVSCASCHQQTHGFSDPARFSTGFDGAPTARHSMGLSFARFYQNGHYFWDEGAPTLEVQTLIPVQDPVEMGMTEPALVARLEATTFYTALFADAIGTADVTADRVAQALAQFVRSIVAPNARYDQARAAVPGPPGAPLPALTPQENRGLQLFFGPARCSTCHRGDLVVGDTPRNNGLDATTTDPGAGNGRFKAPSLRNVELTAPYMHDGRFATLEAVVDHYDHGIQPHPNLDPILRAPGGRPVRLELPPEDRAALVAFLRTLTDRTVTTDPRWSDPFTPPTAEAPGAAPAGVTLTVTPNPARGRALVTVRLPAPAEVEVAVFDAAGRRVATLHDGPVSAGARTLAWDAAGLPAGRYVVRLITAGRSVARTLTLVR